MKHSFENVAAVRPQNMDNFTTVGEAASRVLEKIAEQRATERQPKREEPADA